MTNKSRLADVVPIDKDAATRHCGPKIQGYPPDELGSEL